MKDSIENATKIIKITQHQIRGQVKFSNLWNCFNSKGEIDSMDTQCCALQKSAENEVLWASTNTDKEMGPKTSNSQIAPLNLVILGTKDLKFKMTN